MLLENMCGQQHRAIQSWYFSQCLRRAWHQPLATALGTAIEPRFGRPFDAMRDGD
jgi:hypothetical protein